MSPIADESLDDLLTPKPVLQASLFCKAAHLDPQGRLTITDAFCTLPRGPVPDFVLVNLWRHDSPVSQEYSERLQTRDPDGRVLGELMATPFRLGGDTRCHFSYVRFSAVHLTVPGSHEVRVSLTDTDREAVVATAATPLLVL